MIEDYGDKLDDQARTYLGYLQESSTEMSAMIDGLLALSRSARGELKSEWVNLSNLAQSVVEDLLRQYPERTIKVDIEPGLNDRGDPRLLTVVLINLLENAIKYSEGQEKAEITFGQTSSPGYPSDDNQVPGVDRKCYFVRDNGAGFEMAFKDKLFQPFQRLHRSDEFSGTGIGLATVQRIILRHGGKVWAKSEPGKGATFYFSLNLEEV